MLNQTKKRNQVNEVFHRRSKDLAIEYDRISMEWNIYRWFRICVLISNENRNDTNENEKEVSDSIENLNRKNNIINSFHRDIRINQELIHLLTTRSTFRTN